MKKIKLTKDFTDKFAECSAVRLELETLLSRLAIKNNMAWLDLVKNYSSLNFKDASIDNIKGILILPFENCKDKGRPARLNK